MVRPDFRQQRSFAYSIQFGLARLPACERDRAMRDRSSQGVIPRPLQSACLVYPTKRLHSPEAHIKASALNRSECRRTPILTTATKLPWPCDEVSIVRYDPIKLGSVDWQRPNPNRQNQFCPCARDEATRGAACSAYGARGSQPGGQNLMKQWLTRLLLGPDTKIVRVKSWRPWIGPYGLEWPVMLIDRQGMRSTVVPVWDRHHLRAMAYFAIGRKPPEV